MGAKEFASLLGGLALFLYGMNMMSQGMEAAAGNKMKQILERLTTNRYLGVLVGAVITAIIQSSSATTVMVVGFVNSGMMTLRQAVGVIMGANVGTTVTGWLVSSVEWAEFLSRTVYSIFGCCAGCFSKTAESKKHRRYFSWSWCSFYRNGNDEHRNDAAAGFQSIY